MVHTLAKAYGLLSLPELESNIGAILTVLRPIPADTKELSAYHDRDYLEFVLNSNRASEEEELNAEYGIEEVCLMYLISCLAQLSNRTALHFLTCQNTCG